MATCWHSKGSSGTVYGFIGEQADSATGLLYLRARYYNRALKVFQSRDPWAGSGWRPATLNYYTYVQGNPVNLIDPSGELCIGKWSIGWPRCSDEALRRWDENVALLRQVTRSPAFWAGFAQEFTDSIAAAIPTLVLFSTEWLVQNTNVGAVLQDVFPCLSDYTPFTIINHSTDPYFQAGRAVGRLTAGLLGLGEFFGGGVSFVGTIVGSPAGGVSLAASPVAAQVAAHGYAVVSGVVAKERVDGLIGSLPVYLAQIRGSGGGGTGQSLNDKHSNVDSVQKPLFREGSANAGSNTPSRLDEIPREGKD